MTDREKHFLKEVEHVAKRRGVSTETVIEAMVLFAHPDFRELLEWYGIDELCRGLQFHMTSSGEALALTLTVNP